MTLALRPECDGRGVGRLGHGHHGDHKRPGPHHLNPRSPTCPAETQIRGPAPHAVSETERRGFGRDGTANQNHGHDRDVGQRCPRTRRCDGCDFVSVSRAYSDAVEKTLGLAMIGAVVVPVMAVIVFLGGGAVLVWWAL